MSKSHERIGEQPAFPFAPVVEGVVYSATQHTGLTKREALVIALAANPNLHLDTPGELIERADEILAELAKGGAQ